AGRLVATALEAESCLTGGRAQLEETRTLTARNFDRTIEIGGRGIDVAILGEHDHAADTVQLCLIEAPVGRAEDPSLARVSVCCRPDRVAIVRAGAGISKNAIRVAARRTADSEVRVVPAGHGHEAKAARTHRQVVVVAAAICRELAVIGYGHGIPLRNRAAL